MAHRTQESTLFTITGVSEQQMKGSRGEVQDPEHTSSVLEAWGASQPGQVGVFTKPEAL